MLKLFLVLTALVAVSLAQTDCASFDVSTLITSTRVTSAYFRAKGDLQTEFKTLCDSTVAELTASVADQTKLTATLADFVAKATGAAKLITEITNQLTTIAGAVKSAIDAFTAAWVPLAGQQAAFAALIQQTGDAKAAILLECADLKAAIANATAAVQEAAQLSLQAKLAEQNLMQTALAQFGGLAIGGTIDQASKDKLLAFAKDLAIARAKGQLLDKIKETVSNFVSNNQNAVDKCQAAVVQQQAALALGIHASIDQVKQAVIDNAETFKSRVQNVVKAVVAEVAELKIVSTTLDAVAQAVKVKITVTYNGDIAVLKEKIAKAIQASADGFTLGASVAVYVGSAKRQVGATASATFDLNVSGVAASVAASVQGSTTIAEALAKYTALTNDQAVKDKIAAIVADVAAKTAADLEAAKTAAISVVTAALAAVEAAKTATAAKIADVAQKVQAVQAAIAASATDIKAQITAALALRAAMLEQVKAAVAQRIEEIKAAVEEAKLQVAIIEVQLKDVTEKLKTAAGDAAATLTAQKEALTAAITQKSIEIISQIKAAADAAGGVAALVQKIEAEKAEIQAAIAAAATKFKATAAEIQAKVAAGVEELKAKIGDAVRALLPEIESIVSVSVSTVSVGAKVDIQVNFDSAKISADAIKARIAAVVGAHFNTDKVTVTTSNKRASTMTFSTTAESTDGSSASTGASAGLSGAAIGGIIAGVILLVIIVVVVVIVMNKKKSSDDDYNAMRV